MSQAIQRRYLTDFQSAVLSVVDFRCSATAGYATGGIASMVGRQPGRDTNRQHSDYVGETLRELEVLGYVARLDDETPTVWVRRL